MQNDDLYLVPPLDADKFREVKVRPNSLRLQCCSQLFWCDKQDWEKAKHVLWWFDKDKNTIVNASDITFEVYVGIKGTRLKEGVHQYDYTRACYV